jgi:hypothetical protein
MHCAPADVTTKVIGVAFALTFVVTSGFQQVLVGYLQRKHGVSSSQMLSQTAPIQVRQLLAGSMTTYLAALQRANYFLCLGVSLSVWSTVTASL